MSSESADFPWLWDTSSDPSAFDPEDWFDYCSRLQRRNTPKLPSLAIQTVIPAHMEIVCDRYGVRPDDYTLADHPFACFEHDGFPMVLALSAKGSYAAGGLDELIAMGARHIVFLGGSGAISDEVAVDDLFIPTKALRDECVSFHYIPPSRYAFPSPELTASLLEAAALSDHPVRSGGVWTIMAHFRQPMSRIQRFREEGCLVVNNEASSNFAVGTARGVDVAALLNVGDTLHSGKFEIPQNHPQLYQRDDAERQLDIAIASLLEFQRGATAGRSTSIDGSG